MESKASDRPFYRSAFVSGVMTRVRESEEIRKHLDKVGPVGIKQLGFRKKDDGTRHCWCKLRVIGWKDGEVQTVYVKSEGSPEENQTSEIIVVDED